MNKIIYITTGALLIGGIIETGEREELYELIDQITIASGLNPKEYADGEGISDLWREW